MLSDHQTLLAWLGVFSLLTFVVSLLTLPWLVSMIPEDYFLHQKRHSSNKQQRPITHIILLIGKNLLGGVLLIGGILMLFLPGQGLLTIAIALLLMDYPGKYQLEQYLVAKPVIFNGLNWLRSKNNKPPLKRSAIE